MTSASNDNDQPVTVTPSTQFPTSLSKAGSTSPLTSLANATEPKQSSSNQQQSPVASFPQRTSTGSPTVDRNSSQDTISSSAILFFPLG